MDVQLLTETVLGINLLCRCTTFNRVYFRNKLAVYGALICDNVIDPGAQAMHVISG